MSKSQYVDFRAVKSAVTCPIHGGDNATAFRVSISKNCYCFRRCGCGGNVLDFVAKKENVSLIKAANLLVEWFNLDLPSAGAEADKPSDRPVRAESQGRRCQSEERLASPAQGQRAKGG